MTEQIADWKKFVKRNPDNKMGWYLLGKAYARAGKTAKARYCYAQSGEIYEAFERRKAEIDRAELEKWVRQTEEAAERDARSRRPAVRAALCAILAVLFVGFAPLADRQGSVDRADGSAPPAGEAVGSAAVGGRPPGEAAAGVDDDQRGEDGSLWHVSYRFPADADGAAHLEERPLDRRPPGGPEEAVLLSGAHRNGVVVRAAASDDFRWILWPEPVLEWSYVRKEPYGKWEVYGLHPDLCRCEPDPAQTETAREAVRHWIAREEERIVLASAYAAFYDRYGTWPDPATALARDYPDNVLPGLTPAMEQMAATPAFAVFGRPVAGGTEEDSPAEFGRTAESPLTEPLEIIVDKRNYRLAVVSGKTILRNYPVGLGGRRTPTGEFVISEKVKHPNGRADGEFGSRGMTLSDTLYAIHGTNEPDSIERDESLGCIRMHNEDIEELYDLVPLGTKVVIVEGSLPETIVVPDERFALPPTGTETNPGKVYRWLG